MNQNQLWAYLLQHETRVTQFASGTSTQYGGPFIYQERSDLWIPQRTALRHHTACEDKHKTHHPVIDWITGWVMSHDKKLIKFSCTFFRQAGWLLQRHWAKELDILKRVLSCEQVRFGFFCLRFWTSSVLTVSRYFYTSVPLAKARAFCTCACCAVHGDQKQPNNHLKSWC